MTLVMERDHLDYQSDEDTISIINDEERYIYLSRINGAIGLSRALIHSYEISMPLYKGHIPDDGRIRVKEILTKLSVMKIEVYGKVFIYFKDLKELYSMEEELRSAYSKQYK